MNIDSAFPLLTEIISEAKLNQSSTETEEDAKVRIITRILTEVLGWPHTALICERKHETGYSDYILRENGRPMFLVEAKRAGLLGIEVANKAHLRVLKLSGPALKKCSDAIAQAAGYAAPSGIPICLVTDGLTWIILKPFVSGEHYLEKEAFVFPSLDALVSDFGKFFDLLSRPGLANKTYNLLFDEIHNPRTLLSAPLTAAFPEQHILREQKSDLAFDLEKVFDAFFSRLQGDRDPELLIECFVESRESRIADFTLEKMTAQVLGNIDPSSRDIGEQLSRLVGTAVEQEEGENIFIVGPSGAGKSTFLDRFFQKTLSSELQSRVVPLKLNFLDATGALSAVHNWMVETLIQALEKRLFSDGQPTWEQLRGLYFSEYTRRLKGVDAKLYTSDKDAFQRKFSEFMDRQVESDREEYLRRLLADCVSNRKLLPVIILDNTDEFDLSFKEAAYQLSQSLRRHVRHCLVFIPLTDKSAWSFSKTDLFGIYKSKSFFLPTPAPRDVFRKRIDYLREKARTEDSSENAKTYLLKKGIRVSVPNLQGFASVLEDNFVNDEFVARVLGELANYNIRVTLGLARRIMTSSALSIERVLAAYVAKGARPISRKQILNALVKGDHVMYRRGDAPEVMNVYQVDERVAQSPLVNVRVLQLLAATANAARDVDGQHVSVGSIHDFFEVCGCSEAAVDTSIRTLVSGKLIERFDPSSSALSRDQRLAITHAGRAHLRLALSEYVYFEQMALTTGITSEESSTVIRSAFYEKSSLEVKYARIRSEFAKFLLAADKDKMSIPDKGFQFEAQRELTESVAHFMTAPEVVGADEETVEEVGDTPPGRLTRVEATLDWFSFSKGYGFADCSQVEGQVFLHADTLKQSGVVSVRDGDDLLCDISSTTRGLQITHVYSIETRRSEIAAERCRVVRVFPSRGYGFVRPIHSRRDDQDAFFHFSALQVLGLQELAEGSVVDVEIRSVGKGDERQVARFIGLSDQP